MAKRKATGIIQHSYKNKLMLNQWLISLFGVDPLSEINREGKRQLPFHRFAEPVRKSRRAGLDNDGLHYFYHDLVNSDLFWNDLSSITKEQLLVYEENIVNYTLRINEKRSRPVIWKYFQWLNILFVEIYLDRFFSDKEKMLSDINQYVKKFNEKWKDYADIPPYAEDDLNKICFQNATGSGKTLIMHVNIMQYYHYAKKHGRDKDLSRIILITPNERLSEQHIKEFEESNINASLYMLSKGGIFDKQDALTSVDVIEITKLGDKAGPNTIETRSLGDQNLLLVDEGHRGMSSKEEGAWFTRRSELCAKGFTFEYSATFEQAVAASGNADFSNIYAKAVIFDYSYRWFYEDGYGKDYQILNLPETYEQVQDLYLTACLLKYYQQLKIYSDKAKSMEPFNIEKPLWVFVGSTVSSSSKQTNDEKIVVTDVGKIIEFIAKFLSRQSDFCGNINKIIAGSGRETGLVDKNGNDIFSGSFRYLAEIMNSGLSPEMIYSDILKTLFNNPAGGILTLDRVKGESGEIAMKAGNAIEAFGLINVGDAKGLCDHIEDIAAKKNIRVTIQDSSFTEAMFASIKDSASNINLLIGSKKFIEGWDCWRVSTMGLMHVGKSEGTQIIQLFGRGVRLKGYEWSLKRSGHVNPEGRPSYIEELETLNIFGIEADFMEKFREFLKEEGLPGNERKTLMRIPLNVTYDFGKKLKILRAKCKASDGKEYDFKKDAPVPGIGDIPEYLQNAKIISDWYPRIQSMQSKGRIAETNKDKVSFNDNHLSFIDYDSLYFELEQYKRERSWYNLNITKAGITALLKNSAWYTLYLPANCMEPADYSGVRLLQQIAAELLKRYCDSYYNFCKREYIEPRLELRELTSSDDNIPEDDYYQLIVEADEVQVIQSIKQIQKELEEKKDDLLKIINDIKVCRFGKHLFQPLFHIQTGGKITILPVSLNESEFQFVDDLRKYYENKKTDLEQKGIEIFLLRNMSRGKGVGFFEAGNFHPDFILWILANGRQYINFIEPHGLLHEGIGSDKIQFYRRIKDIEKRLNDPTVTLNSFILSWTDYPLLKWEIDKNDLELKNVLFMREDQNTYIEKLYQAAMR